LCVGNDLKYVKNVERTEEENTCHAETRPDSTSKAQANHALSNDILTNTVN
jgi:hypothetical protein